MIDLGGGDVTGNGISKLVFTILSAVTEAERVRVRVRECPPSPAQLKRDQRQHNRYLGCIVLFGFRVGEDDALIPDATEPGLRGQGLGDAQKLSHMFGSAVRALTGGAAEIEYVSRS